MRWITCDSMGDSLVFPVEGMDTAVKMSRFILHLSHQGFMQPALGKQDMNSAM